jgi:ABC-type Fe3+-hydroxamate transport system substrate-binding protein
MTTEAERPVTGHDAAFVDAAGVRHGRATGNVRIVSLVPSLTETLFALGLNGLVVGRTAFCTHPRDEVRRLRSVGGTKTVNIDKIRALAPTHVLVNVDETPLALAETLASLGYHVVVTHPIEVQDNLALYRLIGGIFSREAEAAALSVRFQDAYDALRQAAAHWPERRVLYLIWKDPWITVGPETYIARMLAMARWHTLIEASDRRYPTVELAKWLDGADVVLFSTEPFPFKDGHLDAFRAGFPRHAQKAFTADGQMLSWYGSRAVDGLAYLCRLAAAVNRTIG